MKIDILSIGKASQSFYKEAFNHYQKPLAWHVRLIEIPAQKDLVRETKLIRQRLNAKAILMVLDSKGEIYSSESFATLIHSIQLQSKPIHFVIGGAEGVDNSLQIQADYCVSFGAMIWPHMLARIMLIEQLYRAYTILNNHPYHRPTS